jgi:hypothetical protein
MPVRATNRRAFIAGLGGAAAWPVMARAQQSIPLVVRNGAVRAQKCSKVSGPQTFKAG